MQRDRKARHDYFIEDRYEAGIVLQGTEIKSVRLGHVQLKDSYISFSGNKELHLLRKCIFPLTNMAIVSIMMKQGCVSYCFIKRKSVSFRIRLN